LGSLVVLDIKFIISNIVLILITIIFGVYQLISNTYLRNKLKNEIENETTFTIMLNNGNIFVGKILGDYKDHLIVDIHSKIKYIYFKDLNKIEINEIDGKYVAKLVKELFNITGQERLKKLEDYWYVDILYNGYHYLAKVDNDGKIVEKLVVPDTSIVNKENVVDIGYNSKTKKLIFKVDEGMKFAYYEFSDGKLNKIYEEDKKFLKKLIGIFERKPEEIKIDIQDPLDLLET
jgi:hypothetical protein